jgi:hypothetical protein
LHGFLIIGYNPQGKLAPEQLISVALQHRYVLGDRTAAIIDGEIYCSHSNYRYFPMTSSIEVRDPETMQHIDSHSNGKLLQPDDNLPGNGLSSHLDWLVFYSIPGDFMTPRRPACGDAGFGLPDETSAANAVSPES